MLVPDLSLQTIVQSLKDYIDTSHYNESEDRLKIMNYYEGINLEEWKKIIIDGKRDPKEVNPEGYLIKNVDFINYLLSSEGDIEEQSAVAGFSAPLGRPIRRKPKEKEVNEVINYLLQKLGV
jgi:hypothetical protein